MERSSVLPSLGTVDSGSVHCWKCGGIGTGTATGTGNKLAAAELTGHSSAPTGLCLCLCANRRVCEFVSVTGSRFLRTLNGTRRCRLFLSFFFFVGLGLHVFEDCAKFWNLRGLFLVLFLVLRLFIVEDQCW